MNEKTSAWETSLRRYGRRVGLKLVLVMLAIVAYFYAILWIAETSSLPTWAHIAGIVVTFTFPLAMLVVVNRLHPNESLLRKCGLICPHCHAHLVESTCRNGMPRWEISIKDNKCPSCEVTLDPPATH